MVYGNTLLDWIFNICTKETIQTCMPRAGVLPKVIRAFFANGVNCWPRYLPSNSLHFNEDDWSTRRNSEVEQIFNRKWWNLKDIHILFEILDRHVILTKQKFILLQNGLSFLKNECGMCAPVNSIIAADLKQFDECVFFRRNLRQYAYVLFKEMKVSGIISKTSDVLSIRPECQFQIVRC